jgi:hypothetical protein
VHVKPSAQTKEKERHMDPVHIPGGWNDVISIIGLIMLSGLDVPRKQRMRLSSATQSEKPVTQAQVHV